MKIPVPFLVTVSQALPLFSSRVSGIAPSAVVAEKIGCEQTRTVTSVLEDREQHVTFCADCFGALFASAHVVFGV